MKNKPFQFRYVNEIVGGFVLLVVALLVSAVVIAGRAQGWFDPIYKVTLDFPPSGSLGLKVGSPVEILGTPVGWVESIAADDSGFMSGVLRIKGDLYQFVRSDSQALVRRKLIVTGDAYVDITKGRGPELPPGAGLVAIKEEDVIEAAMKLLASVTRTVDEFGGLAQDVRAREGDVQRIIANVRSITEKIEQGEGPAGKLISDPEMADMIQQLVAELQRALGQVQDILAYVPGTVLQTQETIRETERLIQGLQNHWLLRKYVPPAPPSTLIPVYDLRRGAGPAAVIPVVEPVEEAAP